MKLHEAWFTKGLISGGFVYSQYHLVARECKTSRYITDRGVKSRGQKVKVLSCVYITHDLSSWFHQRRNQVIPFKPRLSSQIPSPQRVKVNDIIKWVCIGEHLLLLRLTEDQMLMFYWLKWYHHHGDQCLLSLLKVLLHKCYCIASILKEKQCMLRLLDMNTYHTVWSSTMVTIIIHKVYDFHTVFTGVIQHALQHFVDRHHCVDSYAVFGYTL